MLDAPDAAPRVVDRPWPDGRDGFVPVRMRAAALTNLDRAVAQGRHYFSAAEWPRGIGREGVADHDGERVFLTATSIPEPLGSFADGALARRDALLPVPDDIDDRTAAAIGNPGLAAWLALAWRARLAKGESVLVLGATGASGGIAVVAARLLGAGSVVAAGRNAERLAQLCADGADAAVELGEDLSDRLRDAAPGGFDVVLDFLNGEPAEQAMRVLRPGGRLVQIGGAAGPATRVEAQLARRLNLDVLGFAYYHAPPAAQRDAYLRLCQAAGAGQVRLAFTTAPLDAAAEAWRVHGERGTRYVLVP